MRIALATVGTTGDVRPFAVVGAALAARGHDVTAISWPVHAEALAGSGIRVEVAGPHRDPARIDDVAADAATRGPMEQVAILRDFHLTDGDAHLRRLRALLPGHDVVLIHGIHALAHAAVLDERLRWASVVFDPVLLPTGSAPPPGMPNLGPGNRLLWRALDGLLSRTGRPLEELLARAGSPQRLPLFRAHSPLLHIVACSPSLIRVPPDLPPGTSVTGAWIDPATPQSLPDELEAFLAAGPPPAAITFGSMRGVPDDVLAGTVPKLVAAGLRAIAQGGPEALPRSPHLLRIGPIDHRALFGRTSVVLHHGGAGTTHAAAAAGVPSVVVPQIGDQRYWAGRVRSLGIGPAPVALRDATPDRLADTVIATASNDAMRRAAGRLAGRMRDEVGIAESVRLLERIGPQTRQPD